MVELREQQNYGLTVKYICLLLPPSDVATLEGGSCTKNMTSTGGCSYSFVYS